MKEWTAIFAEPLVLALLILAAPWVALIVYMAKLKSSNGHVVRELPVTRVELYTAVSSMRRELVNQSVEIAKLVERLHAIETTIERRQK